jgi:hypothetical protein
MVNSIRQRIRKITNGNVWFNEEDDVSALHMTIQAITRTKNFEEGNTESMRGAL